MTQPAHFGDDKKEPLHSPLARWERAYIDRNVTKLPFWLQSWHLTLMTLPLAAGQIVFGRLARDHHHWLWLSSLLMAAQWWTDSMDGALGRSRREGLIKWGFYMDHFGDFIFMSATFIGWILMLNLPREGFLLMMLMLVYQAMMVSSWLMFGATQKFKITYLGFGPTEVRVFCIVVNIAVICFGTKVFSERILECTLALMTLALVYIVVVSQRRLWMIDKSNRMQ